MLSWLRRRATRQAAPGGLEGRGASPEGLDSEVLECLEDLHDPEVGVSVVHLGLVYRAVRTTDRVDVDLTLTTRTCPLGDLILEDARACLARRFNDYLTLSVRLVWDPVWTPDRITARGLELLGRPPRHLN